MFRYAAVAITIAAAGVSIARAGTVPSGCRATLTPQDARAIALELPNARAFREEQHATLSTQLAGQGPSGAVLVRITAIEPNATSMEVGLYTVNLRSGKVTDDDQEPADDDITRRAEKRLLAKRCLR